MNNNNDIVREESSSAQSDATLGQGQTFESQAKNSKPLEVISENSNFEN
jgi:hypothetical protein